MQELGCGSYCFYSQPAWIINITMLVNRIQTSLPGKPNILLTALRIPDPIGPKCTRKARRCLSTSRLAGCTFELGIQGGLTVLILTRRIGQAIRIGDAIVVTVAGVKDHQVRIGIDAPKTVAVHREEIFAKLKWESDTSPDRGMLGPFADAQM